MKLPNNYERCIKVQQLFRQDVVVLKSVDTFYSIIGSMLMSNKIDLRMKAFYDANTPPQKKHTTCVYDKKLNQKEFFSTINDIVAEDKHEFSGAWMSADLFANKEKFLIQFSPKDNNESRLLFGVSIPYKF